jgi:hypothetical protein
MNCAPSSAGNAGTGERRDRGALPGPVRIHDTELLSLPQGVVGPDLALLATTGSFEATALRTALKHSLTFRNIHRLPSEAPRAPASWACTYARIPTEDDLPWPTLERRR